MAKNKPLPVPPQNDSGYISGAALAQDPNWVVPEDTWRSLAQASAQRPGLTAPTGGAGFLRTAADLGLGVVQGATSIGEGVGTLYGLATGNMDNPLRTGSAAATDYLQSLESDTLRSQRAAAQEAIGQREGWDQAWEAVKQYVGNPRLLSSELSKQVAMIVPGMAAGRLAQGAALGFRAAAPVAQNVGVGAAVGTGAIQQGADIASDTYNRALQGGASHEDALGAAKQAFLESGAISVASQFVPGGTSVERALLRAAPGTMRSLPARFARGFLGEGAQEAIEEGGGQVSGNVNLQRIGQDVDTWKDVGQAAGLGFVLGGALGGPINLLRNPALPEETPPAAPPAPPGGQAPGGVPPAAPSIDYERPTYLRQLDAVNTGPAFGLPDTGGYVGPPTGTPDTGGYVGPGQPVQQLPAPEGYAQTMQEYDLLGQAADRIALDRVQPGFQPLQQIETRIPNEFVDPSLPINDPYGSVRDLFTGQPTDVPQQAAPEVDDTISPTTPDGQYKMFDAKGRPTLLARADEQVAAREKLNAQLNVLQGKGTSDDFRIAFDETKNLLGGLESVGSKKVQLLLSNTAMQVMRSPGNKLDALRTAIQAQEVSKNSAAPDIHRFLTSWYQSLTGQPYESQEATNAGQPVAETAAATPSAGRVLPDQPSPGGTGTGVAVPVQPGAGPQPAAGNSRGRLTLPRRTAGTGGEGTVAGQETGQALKGKPKEKAKFVPGMQLLQLYDNEDRPVTATQRMRLAATAERALAENPKDADTILPAEVRAPLLQALRVPTEQNLAALKRALAPFTNTKATDDKAVRKALAPIVEPNSIWGAAQELVMKLREPANADPKLEAQRLEPIFERRVDARTKDTSAVDTKVVAPSAATQLEQKVQRAEQERANAAKRKAAQPKKAPGLEWTPAKPLTTAEVENLDLTTINSGEILTEEQMDGIKRARMFMERWSRSPVPEYAKAPPERQAELRGISIAAREEAKALADELRAVEGQYIVPAETLGKLREWMSDFWEGEPLFSRAGEPVRKGAYTSKQAAAAIEKMLAKMGNAAPVVVVQSHSQLPREIQRQARQSGARGVFHNGRVYLVADNLRSDAEARFVLAHEMVGHYGLRSILGEDYDAAIDELMRENPTLAKQAQADAGKFGIDVRLAFEEILADHAGALGAVTGWQKFVAAIQKALRALGLGSFADWIEELSNAEQALRAADEVPLPIRALLNQANAYVRNGVPNSAATYNASQLARLSSQPMWYSVLGEAVGRLPMEEGTVEEWIAALRKHVYEVRKTKEGDQQVARVPNLKTEEIRWFDIEGVLNEMVEDFGLDPDATISKDWILDSIAMNTPRINEVVYGYSKEMRDQVRQEARKLFKRAYAKLEKQVRAIAPPDGIGTSGPMYESWVEDTVMERLRIGPDGEWDGDWEVRAAEKKLGVREAQWSDKVLSGYNTDYRELLFIYEPADGFFDGNNHFKDENVLAYVRFDERVGTLGERVLFVNEMQSDWASAKAREKRTGEQVPTAPLMKSYPAFITKRMLRWAAENGFDMVAWPATEDQLAQIEAWDDLKQEEGKYTVDGWESRMDVTPIVKRMLEQPKVLANIPALKAVPGAVGYTEIVTGARGPKTTTVLSVDLRVGDLAKILLQPQPLFSRSTTSRLLPMYQGNTRQLVDDLRQRAETQGLNAKDKLGRGWLQTMPLRALAEQYAKYLPSMRDVVDTLFAKEAFATTRQNEVDLLVRDFQQLDREPELANLLYDETTAGLFADRQFDKQQYVDTLAKQMVEADKITDAEARSILRQRQQELYERWRALPDEAKAVRRRVLELLNTMRGEMLKSLERYITMLEPDTALRKRRITDVRESFTRFNGPYFPLMRFGDYVVAAVKDGKLLAYTHVDNAAEQAQMVRQMQADYPGADIRKAYRTDYGQLMSDTTDFKFISDLHKMVDRQVSDKNLQGALHQEMQRLFISSLPEFHARQRFLPRQNVPGFTRDAPRTLAQNVISAVRYISQLRHNPIVNAGVQDMSDESQTNENRRRAYVLTATLKGDKPQRVARVFSTRHEVMQQIGDWFDAGILDSYTADEYASKADASTAARNAVMQSDMADKESAARSAVAQAEAVFDAPPVTDAVKAGQVFAEVQERINTMVDSRTPKAIQFLGNLTYLWYLGLTPGFMLTNLTQNPMVTQPLLASKFGWKRSWKSMSSAAKRVGLGLRGAMGGPKTGFAFDVAKITGLSADERELLAYLQRNNALDLTQSVDLGLVAQGSGPAWETWQKVMRYGTITGHYTEIYNRLVAALSAYELSGDKMADKQQRFQYVRDIIDRTHVNYSPVNRPSLMTKNALTRLAFQFRFYSFAMTHHVAQMLREATAKEPSEVRTEARKALMYTMGTALAMAGTRGLPFMATVWMLASALGFDDPEEQAMQFVADTLGSRTAAEVLFKGLPVLTGADMSQRIGFGTILPFSNMGQYQTNSSGEEALSNTVYDIALGPFGGILKNFSRGKEFYDQGDIYRAIEQSTPKVLRDMMAANRWYLREGVSTKRGDVLMAADSVGLGSYFWKMMGVTPADVARMYEERGYIIEQSMKQSDKRTQYLTRYRTAMLLGDTEAAEQVRNEAAEDEGVDIKPRAWIDALKRQTARQAYLDMTGGRAATKDEYAILQALDEFESEVD